MLMLDARIGEVCIAVHFHYDTTGAGVRCISGVAVQDVYSGSGVALRLV